MNYSPILCPVCNNKLTYILRKEEDYNYHDGWEGNFHSLYCNHDNVIDIFARDSHALFNFNEDWTIAHLHVAINDFRLNQSSKLISIRKQRSLIYRKEMLININWLSIDSINEMIKTLLMFQ